MPCACKPEIPKYPTPSEWGSIFWKILHSLAEKTGNQKAQILQTQELSAWNKLILSLAYSIPCEECRGHYNIWLETNPVYSLKTMKYIDLREWVRQWLFNLHNSVNLRLSKPIFVYDDLSITYNNINISDEIKKAESIMKSVLQVVGVQRHFWKETSKQMIKLNSMY